MARASAACGGCLREVRRDLRDHAAGVLVPQQLAIAAGLRRTEFLLSSQIVQRVPGSPRRCQLPSNKVPLRLLDGNDAVPLPDQPGQGPGFIDAGGRTSFDDLFSKERM